MKLVNSEKINNIFNWHQIKIKIHLRTDKDNLYFYARDVWWASLGVNIGHEEDGKNKNFERPVLILKKFNKYLVLIIPLTSKLKEDNRYYFKFLLNNKYRSAILSQIRIISSKRLTRKIGHISSTCFSEIKEKIKIIF